MNIFKLQKYFGTAIEIEGTAGRHKASENKLKKLEITTMTKLRGYIPTMLMLVTLMFGTTAANAGIIVGGRTSEETPSTTTLSGVLIDIVTFATTGIIVGGRDGIIVGGRDGIIVGGRDGIIVGG